MKILSRVLSAVLLLCSILIISIPMNTLPELYGQAEIPDELTFHYTKPNPITGHCNPLVPGATGGTIPMVYEPLAKQFATAWFTAGVPFVPIIANSWRFVDPTTFEIKIRDEARFRDGTPVTADDVIFSIDVYTDPKVPGPLSWMRNTYVRLEKVDDKTIRVLLKPEYAGSVLAYNFLGVPIVKKARWEKIIADLGGREKLSQFSNCDPTAYGGVDGTGPYTIVVQERKQYVLKRDPNYWGEKIGLLFAPEYWIYHGDETSETLFRMFDAHQRDLTSMTAYMDPEWVSARSGYLTVWNPIAPSPMLWWEPEAGPKALVLNMGRHSIFREIWFRKVLIYALNFEEIISRALGGQARPLSLVPIHPTLFPEYLNTLGEVVNKTFECTVKVAGIVRPCYNPDLAIKILKEHCEGSPEKGWTCTLSSGEKVKLGPWGIMYVSGWTEWIRPVQVIVDNLKSIGIDAYPDPVEVSVYLTRAQAADYDIAYNWVNAATSPVAGIQWTFTYNYAYPSVGIWWLGQSPFGFQVWWNGSFSPLPPIAKQVKELVDKLWRLDPKSSEFKATVRQLMEIVVPQIPYVPLQYDECFHLRNYVDRWTNWPMIDDYYLYDVVDNGVAFSYDIAMHVYPVKVKMVSFTLSSNTVSKGDEVVAKITLRNEGRYEQRYKIVIALGPRKEHWELWHDLDLFKVTQGASGTLTWQIVKVPPGEHTYEIKFKVNLEPGEYTLLTDPWRWSKWDTGKPLEQKLTVKAPATPTPSPTPTPTPTLVTGVGTVTMTVVVTQSVERTIVSTVVIPSTLLSTIISTVSTTVRETEWTTTIILAVVLFVVGLAIGWIVKRR
jgi:ABC-type transport system substrate-binding protein